jgi:transposase
VSLRRSRSPPISPVDLIACLIDEILPPSQGLGHPPAPTTDVVATLRFFLREGVQWRELRAAPGRVSGATLRRRLAAWTSTGVLQQVHARLIRMVRGGPHVISGPGDIVVDSCSVRAKRGGDLVGPNPTDRGKPGTKYHVAVDADGLPLTAVASAANVNDTRLLPHLLNRALVVCANIGRLIADAGYDSQDNRECCRRYGVLPLIRARGDEHGSGLGTIRRVVENAISWLLMNKRLDRRHASRASKGCAAGPTAAACRRERDRSTLILQALLTTACTFIVAKRAVEF